MEPTLNPESGFFRIRLDFSYDGTNFAGWAKQPDQVTIQSTMESAIATFTRETITLTAAGRTDAGVHAKHQVAHFDLPNLDRDGNPWDIENFAYKLNRILTEDIRIISAVSAPSNFHARFSAISRHYIYKIADGLQTIPPLARFDTTSWYRELDLDRLQAASNYLIGKHDFATFCKPDVGATTIRTLESFNWERRSDGFLIADVIGDAFCYSMVRNMVGAVACVAEGRFEPLWIKSILEEKRRISDSLVFPARGLTLHRIVY
jgi:tRNA pseudouridine38-40 synthase